MSYLDVPRIHFSGSFVSDPSTQNNTRSSYVLGGPVTPLWNKDGSHNFFLKDCTVKMAIGADGKALSSDPVVGGSVETTDDPRKGRMVDVDPDYPTASQIWATGFKVSLKGGGGEFKGKLQTATLRDLWPVRNPEGFASGFSGVYQSVLINTSSKALASSPILTLLSQASAIAIKFVVYAYDAKPGSPTFKQGKIVGTIGLFGSADGDETSGIDLGVHFLQARMMRAPGSGAFGNAPFKLNPGKKKVTVDLGNCIPEINSAGARQNFGNMEAVILLPAPAKPQVLGKLDYSQSHYEQTAGIEDIPITAKQVALLKKNGMGIQISSPSTALVMNERPKGLYVDATEIVFRLNPTEVASVTLVATEFGVLKPGLTLQLNLSRGTPASGISFPPSATSGTAFSITAGDPGNPRGAVDGQVYIIEYYSGPVAPSNLEGQLIVKVYDTFKPKFLNSTTMLPILAQYAQVYPLMKVMMDIGDIAKVKANAGRLITVMNFPEDDPQYMPVTRDLSRDKKIALVAWLALGAP